MLTAVLFDALGTIFKIPAVQEPLVTRALRDALALEATGSFAPLSDVIAAELALRHRHDTSRVLGRFARLRAERGARAAFERTRALGLRVVILTNASAEPTHASLRHNGLSPLVDAVVSVDEARHYKPHVEAYGHAAQRLAAAPAELALVSAHAWDIHGARLAGMYTAWVRGLVEPRFAQVFDHPDVAAESLIAAVDAVAEYARQRSLSPGAGSTPPMP